VGRPPRYRNAYVYDDARRSRKNRASARNQISLSASDIAWFLGVSAAAFFDEAAITALQVPDGLVRVLETGAPDRGLNSQHMLSLAGFRRPLGCGALVYAPPRR
jgi:hypothetical protein